MNSGTELVCQSSGINKQRLGGHWKPLDTDEDLKPGDMVTVVVTDADEYDLWAQLA